MIPGIPDNPSGYDKITVVQICLNRECQERETIESELTGMLNVLFDPKIGSEKKIEKLENEYHMEMEKEFGKELNQMCNFSDYVEELGIQRGQEQGLAQGLQRGRTELNTLYKKLLDAGRMDELERAIQDEEYLEKLWQEFEEKKE